jgi:hypothetical protein
MVEPGAISPQLADRPLVLALDIDSWSLALRGSGLSILGQGSDGGHDVRGMV